MEGAQGDVLIQHYAVLYKRPIETCRLYPIAHIAVEPGTDLTTWLAKPPKAKGYPRYGAVWKRLGAPVRQMSYCQADPDDATKWIVIQTPLDPIIYLQPRLTKEEVKATQRGATGRLAKYFVNNHLKRAWTKADYGGQHMAHSKKILGLGYTVEQVVECLQRLERGDLTDGVPWVEYTQYHNFRRPGWTTLLCVLWGEPPSIEREPNTITNLNMTPEQWAEWRATRKQESAIVDEPSEETALRDFANAPGWVKKDQ